MAEAPPQLAALAPLHLALLPASDLARHLAAHPHLLGLGPLQPLAPPSLPHLPPDIAPLAFQCHDGTLLSFTLQSAPCSETHFIAALESFAVLHRAHPAAPVQAALLAESFPQRVQRLLRLVAPAVPSLGIQVQLLQLGDQKALHFTRLFDHTGTSHSSIPPHHPPPISISNPDPPATTPPWERGDDSPPAPADHVQETVAIDGNLSRESELPSDPHVVSDVAPPEAASPSLAPQETESGHAIEIPATDPENARDSLAAPPPSQSDPTQPPPDAPSSASNVEPSSASEPSPLEFADVRPTEPDPPIQNASAADPPASEISTAEITSESASDLALASAPAADSDASSAPLETEAPAPPPGQETPEIESAVEPTDTPTPDAAPHPGPEPTPDSPATGRSEPEPEPEPELELELELEPEPNVSTAADQSLDRDPFADSLLGPRADQDHWILRHLPTLECSVLYQEILHQLYGDIAAEYFAESIAFTLDRPRVWLTDHVKNQVHLALLIQTDQLAGAVSLLEDAACPYDLQGGIVRLRIEPDSLLARTVLHVTLARRLRPELLLTASDRLPESLDDLDLAPVPAPDPDPALAPRVARDELVDAAFRHILDPDRPRPPTR